MKGKIFIFIMNIILVANGITQKEGTTLLSLLRKSHISGIMRMEGFVIKGGIGECGKFVCIKPIKGCTPWEVLYVKRNPDLCMEEDIRRLKNGQEYFVFLKKSSFSNSCYSILPRGIILPAEETYEAVKALFNAEKTNRLPLILAEQLKANITRIKQDALLSLFTLKNSELYTYKKRISKILLDFINSECKKPSPVFPWAVELGVRLSLKNTVPSLVKLSVATKTSKGIKLFAARAIKKLNPKNGISYISKLDLKDPEIAENAVFCLSIIGSRDAEPILEKLLKNKSLNVRVLAAKTLAKVNPSNLTIRKLLFTNKDLSKPIAETLLESQWKQTKNILIQAARINPEIKSILLKANVESKKPKFKALFKTK